MTTRIPPLNPSAPEPPPFWRHLCEKSKGILLKHEPSGAFGHLVIQGDEYAILTIKGEIVAVPTRWAKPKARSILRRETIERAKRQ